MAALRGITSGGSPCRFLERGRTRQRLVAPPMDTDDVLEELARMGVPTELRANPADGERLDWTCAIDGISSAFAYAERQAARSSG